MAGITETYAVNKVHFPNKIAIQTPTEQINYQTWYELVCKTANWLDSLHVTRKTIGILLPNGIPFLQLFAGASMAGWIAVPFDPKWTEGELQKRLSLSRPSVFVTVNEVFQQVSHIDSSMIIWDNCLAKINQFPVERAQLFVGNLPFYMGFTSGTTGEPKGFIRSQASWTASFDCNQVDFQISNQDIALIPGSLIYSHFLYGAISTLYLGGTVFLLEKFSPLQTLDIIETQPITVVYLVPTMIAALLAENHITDKPVKFLSSGAKWEEHSKKQIRKLFPNLSMYEFYGASELSFVTVSSDHDSYQKPGSVGKPCHNVEIQIRLADSVLAKPNETGKIYVKSDMVFIGYLTDESIQSIEDENGWVTVHDMGYIDDDGFLYIKGREKNMILYGGINVFPEEIEKVLSTHPDVEEAAVIGLYDSYWGQIVTAVVKGTASRLDLKRVCRQNLASYKVPRKWVFVEELPYTSSGKIARAKLKELIESKVESH
ncbi:AMP-binding protein [Bacillus sp. EB600]|uniref:AMP-binding protein n=1 Tax=Bacillus sp. EB600 TaxID=2806345 RepID=UPI00210D3854|nr:AMP-binding protein [Bacillus sp. EB600]MCQ6280455.1 AMP-binding protein [Bacillus sp. EB600]